jgi:hypothetical protein
MIFCFPIQGGTQGAMRVSGIGVLACCVLFAQSAPPQNLTEVKTIFVDSLGQGDGPMVIRDKIINRLATSGRFQVALGPEKADAILTGSANETSTTRYANGTGGSRIDATVAIRLITKDQKILWVSETKNGSFTRNASSSVADNVVKGLLKAAAVTKQNPTK